MKMINGKKLFGLNVYTEAAANILKVVMYFNQRAFAIDPKADGSLTEYNSICRDDDISPDGEVMIESDSYSPNPTNKKISKDFTNAISYFMENGGLLVVNNGKVEAFSDIEEQKNKKSQKDVFGVVNGCIGTIFMHEIQTMIDKPDTIPEYIQIVKFKISDIWLLHDFFKGKSVAKLLKTYSKEAIKHIIGVPRNPLWIEQIKLKKEELQQLEDLYKERYDALEQERTAEINKLYDIYKKKFNLLLDEHEKESNKIKAEFDKIEEQWKSIS